MRAVKKSRDVELLCSLVHFLRISPAIYPCNVVYMQMVDAEPTDHVGVQWPGKISDNPSNRVRSRLAA